MQERARLTRGALLQAAAVEFDCFGYSGTSLSRISGAAEVTMGALTFHFHSKTALADAVRRQGVLATRPLLLPGAVAGPVELIESLIDLLQTDVEVRAAARLTREQPDAPHNWYAAWEQALRALAQQVGRVRPLPGQEEESVTALVQLGQSLVVGAEATRRGLVGSDPTHDQWPTGQLPDLMRRVLRCAFDGSRILQSVIDEASPGF